MSSNNYRSHELQRERGRTEEKLEGEEEGYRDDVNTVYSYTCALFPNTTAQK